MTSDAKPMIWKKFEKFHLLAQLVIMLLLGAATLCTQAGVGLWPFVFILYGFLFYALAHARTHARGVLYALLFATGACFATVGFGFHVMWLLFIKTFSGGKLLAAVVFVVSFVGLYGLSILVCGAAAIAVRANKISPHIRPWIFAAVLTLGEGLRGFPIETGAAWGMTGYAAAGFLPLAQLAYLGGVYLTGFVMIALAALAVSSRAQKIQAFCVACVALCFGLVHMQGVTYKKVRPVYIVQADLGLEERTTKTPLASLRAYAAATRAIDVRDEMSRPLVIWPETAVRDFYGENAGIVALVKGLTRDKDLLTGVLQRAVRSSYTTRNAVAYIGSGGTVLQSVDKKIRVPFFERMPLAQTLRGFYSRYLPAVEMTEAGTSGPHIQIENFGRVAVLNCYEVIFPRHVKDVTKNTDAIVQVTDDAWLQSRFAKTQMLVAAQFRAIENNLPLLRVANAGYNALIDPKGRIVAVHDPDNLETLEIKNLPFAAGL